MRACVHECVCVAIVYLASCCCSRRWNSGLSFFESKVCNLNRVFPGRITLAGIGNGDVVMFTNTESRPSVSTLAKQNDIRRLANVRMTSRKPSANHGGAPPASINYDETVPRCQCMRARVRARARVCVYVALGGCLTAVWFLNVSTMWLQSNSDHANRRSA